MPGCIGRASRRQAGKQARDVNESVPDWQTRSGCVLWLRVEV